MSIQSTAVIDEEVSIRPVELLKHDKVIRDKLTTRQLDFIDAKSRVFEPKSPFRAKRLSQALVSTLVDLKQFRFCGRSFQFKLNTILKCFKKNTWRPPIHLANQTVLTEEALTIQRKINEIDAQRLGLILSIKDNQRLAHFHTVQKTGMSGHYLRRVEEYESLVERLEVVTLQLEFKLSHLTGEAR